VFEKVAMVEGVSLVEAANQILTINYSAIIKKSLA